MGRGWNASLPANCVFCSSTGASEVSMGFQLCGLMRFGAVWRGLIRREGDSGRWFGISVPRYDFVVVSSPNRSDWDESRMEKRRAGELGAKRRRMEPSSGDYDVRNSIWFYAVLCGLSRLGGRIGGSKVLTRVRGGREKSRNAPRHLGGYVG